MKSLTRRVTLRVCLLVSPDVVHADHVVLGPGVAEVPVGEHHQVPDGREEGPRDQEGGGEAEQGPGPGKVDHRGEEVLQEPVMKIV